jgi:cytochrome c553
VKRWVVRGTLAAVLVLVAGAIGVVSGVVPIDASGGHWAITAAFLQLAKRRSVATHSRGVEVPPQLGDPAHEPRLARVGAGHYHLGCEPCHGAPGVPRSPVALAMTPTPPVLSETAGAYDDAALFYLVMHGIKLTGMPAWPAQERPDEVWALVAFMRRMPSLDRAGYLALTRHEIEVAPDVPEIVADRCARCHGADGLGGPGGAFPRIGGQRHAYLEGALEAYRAGERHSGIMQTIAATLSRRDVVDAVAWYASRPPMLADLDGTSDDPGRSIARDGIPARRIPACADCHGPGDASLHPAYPILAGQHAHYLERQLELFVRGERGGGDYARVMRVAVAAHTLEPEEVRAVARFYSSLHVGR